MWTTRRLPRIGSTHQRPSSSCASSGSCLASTRESVPRAWPASRKRAWPQFQRQTGSLQLDAQGSKPCSLTSLQAASIDTSPGKPLPGREGRGYEQGCEAEGRIGNWEQRHGEKTMRCERQARRSTVSLVMFTGRRIARKCIDSNKNEKPGHFDFLLSELCPFASLEISFALALIFIFCTSIMSLKAEWRL